MFLCIRKLIKKEIIRQTIFFLTIGGSATILNYLMFIFLFKLLSFHYILSVIIGYLFGLIFTFTLNKNYTFNSKEKIGKSMVIFVMVNLFTLILNLVLLSLFVGVLETNATITYFFILAFITPLKFIGSKILAFKNREW